MRLLSRIPLKTRLVLLAALVAGIVITLWPKPTTACPPQANIQYMYSEPELINHVGTRWVNCYAPYIVQQGTMTQWRIVESGDGCGCCPAGGC
jgi:hypothetical protein